MQKFLMAVGLLAGVVSLAAPAQATVTWQGLSTIVYNDDEDSENYGQPEQYVVTFSMDDTAPFVFLNQATQPQSGFDVEYYDWAFFRNITSYSISGPRFDLTIGGDGTFSRVSTLRYARAQGGVTGFSAFAGTDADTDGYKAQFNYWLTDGFPNIARPTSLDIADAAEAGFVLLRYTPIEDTEEFEAREVLNFRFVSGGFLPAAGAVPEPATWAMMVAGFGIVGGTMRRRQKVHARIRFA